MERYDLVYQPQVLGEEGLFVCFGETAPAGDQGGQRFLGQPIGIDPGEVKENLQIAEIIWEERDNILPETVISQSLAAGQSFDAQETITLVVSKEKLPGTLP